MWIINFRIYAIDKLLVDEYPQNIMKDDVGLTHKSF